MTQPPTNPPPPPFLAIVYADEHVAVINKPARLLSVPGKGPANQDCVASRARELFPAATGPLIVHRLDMDTSGLLVLGLTPHAQRDLSRQFEQRLTSKSYIAVVVGDIAPDAGEVSLPIRTDIDNRPHQIVDFTHGKPSVTRFAVISRSPGRTRLRLIPVTGRTHQLRVHCASGLHAPIVGDPLYGDPTLAPRMLLHAAEIAFTHPATQAPLSLAAPPDF